MHIHFCSQELALIAAILPYVNLGYIYACQACGWLVGKFRYSAAYSIASH